MSLANHFPVPEGHMALRSEAIALTEEVLTARTPHGDVALPAGHIALKGDFPAPVQD